MHGPATSPAKQLKSVALRYRCARFAGDIARWRSHWLWWDQEPVARSAAPAAAEALPTQRDDRLRRLEAVLFLAREPLNSRKLSQFAQLTDGTEARTLVRRLNKLYDDGRRAFRVEEVAGGYQLLSRPKLAPWLRRLQYLPPEARLSVPAMETLAVIAYRQPVLRADIEAIRGVNCGEILRQLMERDLVRIAGRSEELGRPFLYATTKRFLQTFGLYTLDQLPRAEALRLDPADIVQPADPASHLDERSKEESDVSVTTAREFPHPEQVEEAGALHPHVPRAAEEEEEEGLEEEVDDDDELDEDDEDYEYYDDDDEEEDEELDEGEEDDEDYEDEEWEEVDDDDEWEDDEDMEWDDDDDDDELDDEESEEEEDEEDWD